MRGRSTSRNGLTAIGVTVLLAGGLLAGCGDDEGAQAGSAVTGTTAPGSTTDAGSVQDLIRAEFQRADKDGNGSVDAAETEASIDTDCDAADLNGDGVITIEDVQLELDDAGGGEADQPLSDYMPHDSDGDGQITRVEHLESVRSGLVAEMDADSSGEITVDEAVGHHASAGAGGGS